jgi:hypothetical protein
MSNSIIYNNFEFRWNRSDKTCFISIHNGGHHQGIISFDSPFDYVTSQQYYLYCWYDEGDFPEEFDTVDRNNDNHSRLKITGVDEV